MQTHPLTGSEVRDQCLGCLLALRSRVSLTDVQKHAVLEEAHVNEDKYTSHSDYCVEKWCLWLSKINHYSL